MKELSCTQQYYNSRIIVDSLSFNTDMKELSCKQQYYNSRIIVDSLLYNTNMKELFCKQQLLYLLIIFSLNVIQILRN